jgi:FtsZ-interacting cell division protein YlmF
MQLQNPKHRVKSSLTSTSSNDDQYDAITRRINSFFNCFEEDNNDDDVNNDNNNDEDDDITGQNSSVARDDDAKLSFLLCSDDAASSIQYFSKTRHQNILGPYNFMVDDVDHCSLRIEDMSLKDLKTLSLQLKLLHLLLQKKTVADEKKVEEDMLLAWQLVRNAEQSVRSLSMPSHASMGQQQQQQLSGQQQQQQLSGQQQQQQQEHQRMILRRLTETV